MINLKENEQLAEAHFKKIEAPIQSRINAIVAANSFVIDRTRYVLNPRIVALITPYLIDATLKELVVCRPEILNNKAQHLNLHQKSYIDKRSVIFKLLYRIFVDYGYEQIDKLTFIREIAIDTCPYCNRNYIYSLDKGGKIKPEIDHFYPKSIYPLFAASYYNLIPSCQTCNGFGAKHSSDTYLTNLTNPYLIKDSDFKFKYKINSIAKLNPLSGKSSVDVLFEKSLPEHLVVFKLDKLYAKHSDHVIELIVKSKMKYSPKYRAYLRSYQGLKFSEIELNRLILGNYSRNKDLHKRPLSKLYSDIGKKLGLITDL